MCSWTQHISEASAIFVRAPKHLRKAFTSGKNCPLNHSDKRIRQIPFMTRRPTFKEVRSVHSQLATLYSGVIEKQVFQAKLTLEETDMRLDCGHRSDASVTLSAREELNISLPSSGTSDEGDKSVQCQNKSSAVAKKPRRRRKGTKPKEECVDPLAERMITLCQDGSVGDVQAALADMGVSVGLYNSHKKTCPLNETQGESLVSPCFDINSLVCGSTLLHAAASAGQSAVVTLLLQAGANPTVK